MRRSIISTIIFLIFSLLILSSSATKADNISSSCLPSIVPLHDRLTRKYGEHISGFGLDESGSLWILYTGSATWTIIVVTTSGTACLIGDGEKWQPTVQGSES